MATTVRRDRRLAVALPGFLLGGFLAWVNLRPAPLLLEPLASSGHAEVVDEELALARRYAPFLYKEFHPRLGRQDIPSPVDFDGNLAGDANWINLARFELLPTVYYAVLETETHWFFTYHLFHPRDWTHFDLGLHLTHENDGENMQVVVAKDSDEVVLLFTQAHYRGGAYAAPDSGFDDGEVELRGRFQLVDEAGVPSSRGLHAAAFVESGGHGIYGTLDPHSGVTIRDDGRADFARSGWILRPRRAGEQVREPELIGGATLPYRLESLTAKLWPLLARGELTGEGRLLDGALAYSNPRISIGVPRYYEADRFSGPLGSDRGISPFAVDFHFGAGEVGALFFGPAERYAKLLTVPEPWSLEYERYPFYTPGAAR